VFNKLQSSTLAAEGAWCVYARLSKKSAGQGARCASANTHSNKALSASKQQLLKADIGNITTPWVREVCATHTRRAANCAAKEQACCHLCARDWQQDAYQPRSTQNNFFMTNYGFISYRHDVTSELLLRDSNGAPSDMAIVAECFQTATARIALCFQHP
jgi:hypothetical protein